MARPNVDWDSVPDEELHETCWERVEALKEIFPLGVRQKVSNTADWTYWATKKTFSFTRSALWIGSTTAIIMLLPVIVEKELSELTKSAALQQQQMLLGTGPK